MSVRHSGRFSAKARKGDGKDWNQSARDAVDNETIGTFLLEETSIDREKYLIVLEHIYKHYPQEKARFQTVFDRLEGNRFFKNTKPLKTADGYTSKHVRRDRVVSERRPHLLSYYDIFESSIIRSDKCKPHDLTLGCSPLTKIIWEHAEDQLWDGGAIFACAEHNLSLFLQYLLGKKVLGKKLDNDVERMQIAFLSGPNNEYTPLGIAIRKQNSNCVSALLLANGAEAHVRGAKNVLVDDVMDQPILHTTLDWARQSIGVNNPFGTAELESLKDMLQEIIRIDQTTLTQHNPDGVPPYRYAVDMGNCFDLNGENEIEIFLRDQCFRLKDPDDLRKALYEKTDPGRELGLDLSDFNHDSTHFADFVDELQQLEEDDLVDDWEFEDTLLYVNLPSLRKDVGIDTVETLLKWLHNRNVRSIKSFRLPDYTAKYDIDFIVQHIMGLFEVDSLDWIRLDADIPGLAKKCVNAQPQIKPLELISLYFNRTQGLRVADVDKETAEWLDYVGTLRATPVEVVKTMGTPFQVSYDPENATWTPYTGYTLTDQLSQDAFHPNSRTFYSILPDERSFLHDKLRDCHSFLSDLENLGTPNPTNAKTKHCLKIMSHQRVKIALIDNGVDRTSDGIRALIERGASFVRAGGRTEIPQLPWFTAADSHGTQMAHLIRQANPWCRLYPTRVGSLQRDIDAKAAAEAIEWATDQGVDIISMSWVIMEECTELKAAIAKAAEARILLFCSTPDTGQSSLPVYPANYDNVITVSAADVFGGPRPESYRDVHLMLDGEDIPAKGPCFIKGDDPKITGSSVATALAAGLASLCLFLARMANQDTKGAKCFKDRLNMLAIFRPMQLNSRDRFLIPSQIFGAGFKCDERFREGTMGPPEGLNHFIWTSFDARLELSRLNPFDGSVPRRDMSRERAKMKRKTRFAEED